jgi:hypothetical protein
MATAAMRIVVRGMLQKAAAAAVVNSHSSYSSNNSSAARQQHVHDIANDLHTITGHGTSRQENDGSVHILYVHCKQQSLNGVVSKAYLVQLLRTT